MNPFASSGTAVAERPSSNAVAQTDQQRAIAEVQAAMMIARTNPRNPVAAVDRILNACTRPTLAKVAVYQYAKGGADVSGPSIRLAEAIAQQWGNIKTSVRELDQSNGVSTVQTIAWDLESGYQCDKVFQVPHLRYTRNGSKRLEDPRDIYELVANQGARRLRACILAVIPGDVVEAAVNQCEVTMHAAADCSPDGIAKMLKAFSKYGVAKEHIEKLIQRRLDAIQPAQVVNLEKIYASLRDGMSKPEDWFDGLVSDTQQAAVDKAAEAYKKRTEGAQPSTPEQAPAEPKVPAVTFDSVLKKMLAAKNEDALNVAADWIGEVDDADKRKELGAKYDELLANFRG